MTLWQEADQRRVATTHRLTGDQLTQVNKRPRRSGRFNDRPWSPREKFHGHGGIVRAADERGVFTLSTNLWKSLWKRGRFVTFSRVNVG
jgi:hypothetical protein